MFLPYADVVKRNGVWGEVCPMCGLFVVGTFVLMRRPR